MYWSWRHREQQEACKPEGMCLLGNTARLLTWSSAESWLIVCVYFKSKEQKGWNLLQSESRKSLSFLKQTKHIACIDVVICEICSGRKFPNDAQHQDCIKTEAGSALPWHREGAANGTQFQRPS